MTIDHGQARQTAAVQGSSVAGSLKTQGARAQTIPVKIIDKEHWIMARDLGNIAASVILEKFRRFILCFVTHISFIHLSSLLQ